MGLEDSKWGEKIQSGVGRFKVGEEDPKWKKTDQNVFGSKFKMMDVEEYDNYKLDKEVGAVVLGLDTSFTTLKL